MTKRALEEEIVTLTQDPPIEYPVGVLAFTDPEILSPFIGLNSDTEWFIFSFLPCPSLLPMFLTCRYFYALLTIKSQGHICDKCYGFSRAEAFILFLARIGNFDFFKSFLKEMMNPGYSPFMEIQGWAYDVAARRGRLEFIKGWEEDSSTLNLAKLFVNADGKLWNEDGFYGSRLQRRLQRNIILTAISYGYPKIIKYIEGLDSMDEIFPHILEESLCGDVIRHLNNYSTITNQRRKRTMFWLGKYIYDTFKKDVSMFAFYNVSNNHINLFKYKYCKMEFFDDGHGKYIVKMRQSLLAKSNINTTYD